MKTLILTCLIVLSLASVAVAQEIPNWLTKLIENDLKAPKTSPNTIVEGNYKGEQTFSITYGDRCCDQTDENEIFDKDGKKICGFNTWGVSSGECQPGNFKYRKTIVKIKPVICDTKEGKYTKRYQSICDNPPRDEALIDKQIDDGIACILNKEVELQQSQSTIDSRLRELYFTKVPENHVKMADKNSEYNSGSVANSLPETRLIFAGKCENYVFLHFESGGILGPNKQTNLYIEDGKDLRELASFSELLNSDNSFGALRTSFRNNKLTKVKW